MIRDQVWAMCSIMTRCGVLIVCATSVRHSAASRAGWLSRDFELPALTFFAASLRP